MATIYGPQKGHATLYDTSGNDTIVAAGGYNTINSLYGNDTISGGSIGYNTILAGTQYDYAQRDVSIRVNGLGNTIDGGDSNFTISSWTGDATINLGDGNDNLTLGGLNNTVTIGLGADNIVAGSGDDSVTVVGLVSWLNGPAPETIAVHFSGHGNSFYNGFYSTSDGSAEDYPLPVVSTITGGSGDGNFTLWGGGSVVTDGLNNNIFVGDGNYNIVAGSGDDSVNMDSPFGGMTVNVTLAGSGNSVSGGGGGPLVANISGGTGDTTVNMGDGLETVQANIRLGGSHNTITAQGMSGSVDPGGDGAIVNLTAGGNLDVMVHGAGDFIGLGDAINANINDQSNGLQIDVSGAASATIYNFGFDRGAVLTIDLQFGYPQPFQNATQIVDALQQTSGGALLSYGPDGGGSFLFAGVSVSQLHASNFAV
jgi:hypothetical protein